MPETAPALSVSVKALADDLGERDVTAFTIANALIATHAYGGRQAGELRLEAPVGAESRPVTSWLRDVAGLYDPRPDELLDGRRAVFGLALLDSRLADVLAQNGFLAGVEQELAERGGLQLSSEGARLHRALRERSEMGPGRAGATAAEWAGAVPTLEDAPAELDELGRATLAEVLARRIRRVRLQGQTRAFRIHVDGPWGSGKSSLLNLLAKELRGADRPKKDRWIVVTFNAWAHQRIDPPWWWLMTKVHRDGMREVRSISRGRAGKLLLLELWWRLRDGWAAYLLLPLAVVVLVLLWRRGVFGEDLTDAHEALQAIGGLIAFVALIWGVIKGLRRWLVTGPGGAALLDEGRDPLRRVRSRFARLVAELEPLAIFIDDLDRCKDEYVVHLLEGIQTLFADERVVWVVAADAGWLRDAYRHAYEDFASNAVEPGRSLGTLFLEKTFQQSVPVPGIPPDIRERYWKRLLSERREPETQGTREDRRQAEGLFEPLGNEGEVMSTLRKAEQDGQIDSHELRRAAALQLSTKAVEVATRHALDDFAPLLEDNPRAMKKLVNSYGLQRDLQVIEGGNVAGDEGELRQLALWTIVSIRWPLLAEYLADHPEEVSAIGEARPPDASVPDGFTPELDRLFRDEAVQAVVKGQGVKPAVRLDEAAIRRFSRAGGHGSGLRSSRSAPVTLPA